MDSLLAKPATVKRAILILYARLGLGVLGVLYNAIRPYTPPGISSPLSGPGSSFRIIALGSVGLLISWLLIFLIGRRHNWVRHLMLISFVFTLIATPLGFYTFHKVTSMSLVPYLGGPVRIGLSLITTLLTVGALFFLFKGDSNKWFKAKA